MRTFENTFSVMVPIRWTNGTENRFKVDMGFDGELTKEAIADMKQKARDYVLSKGQTLAETSYNPIQIYRKTGKGKGK
jgi:hypothetical protein